MAVAETRKVEKDEEGTAAPAWLSGALGWLPRKLAQLRAFFSEVKAELKKVTWPGKAEVYATTVVVILTTVFFGFYLFLLDIGFSELAKRILSLK